MWGDSLKRFLLQTTGKVGKGISTVGTALHAPQLAPGGYGAQLQSKAGYMLSQMNPINPPSVLAAEDTNTSQLPYQGVPDAQVQLPGGYTTGGNPTYQPSSGGQPAGGGGGGQQENGGYDYLQALRDQYGSLRSMYESQIPQWDADYSRVKGDVQGAVDRAKEVLGERKNEINVGFGENLRNMLKSDRELRERSNRVYSGLGTLDSSSYLDEQNKRDQALLENQSKMNVEKQKQTREAERQYSEYESQANQQLSDLGNQYLQGKQALQAAIAQNNLNEASTIQNYINQIQDRAYTLQQNLIGMKMNLAQLAAQGVDVVGGLNKINSGGLNQIFGNYLSNVYNPAMNRLTIPGVSPVGSGYIGKTNEDDYLKRLMGQA